MTDNEIRKALECCASEDLTNLSCIHCPNQRHDCMTILYKEALALINRQMAEIERLQSEKVTALRRTIASAKVQAVKQFAEKLKDTFVTIDGTFECWEIEEHIDSLVKEMTEETP